MVEAVLWPVEGSDSDLVSDVEDVDNLVYWE